MSALTVTDFAVINKGALAASLKLHLQSGMVIRCLLFRQKRDPSAFFVVPAAEKLAGGGYSPIIEFVTPERAQAFQQVAMTAVQPYLAELARPKRQEPAEQGGYDDCPF